MNNQEKIRIGKSRTEKLAKNAKLIVSGMAMYPTEDGKVLVVNLHNTHYKAQLALNGKIICSNMGEDTLKKVTRIFEENKEFL